MADAVLLILPLVAGYLLDLWLGDPDNWPHPVRVFGDAIAKGEKWLNRGQFRFWKGATLSVVLVVSVFTFFQWLDLILLRAPALYLVVNGIWVYYGLANHSLIAEGRAVFSVLENEGLEAGRRQLSRIVGRDTSKLNAQQIRIAVLETMSENLSDGVVAPLFYYALAGVPGMMAYKMINTMDSMLGYRSERYEWFGKFAARLDDVANFIPARLTALLMVLVTGSRRGLQFVFKFGNRHKSPNAGYPEAALAGILDCRFGGPNVYHGKLVEKPFIGENDRVIEPPEIARAASVNQRTCMAMVLIISFSYLVFDAAFHL
ncbi:adenosylcobinamide-phosphate synthase [Dyadobacter sp. BE34]|uniref:Cobalamin biosynthesis protein CobD n=1 Tax=Dyadobacter fermentans TaxID=94254 RepID=A0ABU1QTC9_9BACT|nr:MULTISPECIES: adenosylcobinamide-phosphate synthase CbiB [Dyadobacter]MDR6804421.1 adenosylcobinamide-phosphate synthase [Dyadobacter fermentans]MDR7042161.1 adenosylcobinamide-phosphate synthase [Dyadobacter sp. BE242]MDR7196563.1 adenosylcobinamide-phosphate synthase [Dyadobacter sp. BE34]MDR7212891.1 adenosylcobinamide-phosphate synthase [Dyadobacter sp. BE31]MDR7261970.1 adenosylcobinamide-phosphate synthase [Dyadobacter sp. BE32]